MLYTLTLFLFGVVLVHLLVRSLRKYGTYGVGGTPLVLFPFFVLVIHVVVPLVKFDSGVYRYASRYDSDISALLSFILLLSFCIAYVLIDKLLVAQFKKINFRKTERNRRQLIDRPVYIFIIACLSFLIGAYGAYANYGSLDDDYLADRISAGVGRGFSTQLPNFLMSASVLLLYIRLQLKAARWMRGLAGALFMLSMISAFIYYNSINSRNSIFIFIFLAFGVYSVLRPELIRLSTAWLRKIGLVVVIGTAFTVLVISATQQRYSGDNSYAEHRREHLVYYMLDGAFGNDENLIWMMSNPYDMNYGITYVAAFANLIPRAIWADKPLGAGPRLRNAIYPGSYVVGREGNTSYTTGLYTEAMLNFGVLGLVIIPALWALIATFFARKVMQNVGNVSQIMWAASLVLWSSSLMYAEFLGFFGRFVFTIIPILLAAKLGTKVSYRVR